MFTHLRRKPALLLLMLSAVFSTALAGADPRPAGASSATLPDPIADRILGQSAFNLSAAAGGATGLNQPAGVAVAPDGRLFVVDYGNNRVLSWPSATSFTVGQAADLALGQPDLNTVAPGSALNRMQGPEAVAIDSAGRVYIADTNNQRVLYFDQPLSTGMAASGAFGTLGASAALENRFQYPRGLAIDAQQNLYLVDEFNDRVLLYQTPRSSDTLPDKQITGLNGPRGVAADLAGNIYVTDSQNDRVQIYQTPLASDDYTADLTLGGPEDGTATQCQEITATPGAAATTMDCPIDIAIDTQLTVYVTDIFNHRILAYRNPLGSDSLPDAVFGQETFTASQPNHGGGASTTGLYNPLGMAVDTAGNLFVADFLNNRMLVFNAPPAQLTGVNLIQNGDAEANPGADNTGTLAPASWEVEVGALTTTRYGASGGFPFPTNPGPPNRGANFFGGGFEDTTISSQRVDVSALGTQIDEGSVTYQADGYFGGFGAQNDYAYLSINFHAADGQFIDQFLLGNVTAAERGNQTGLLLRSKTGTLPANTRYIEIRLLMERTVTGSFNDGYADNLSLVLFGESFEAYLPLVQKP